MLFTLNTHLVLWMFNLSLKCYRLGPVPLWKWDLCWDWECCKRRARCSSGTLEHHHQRPLELFLKIFSHEYIQERIQATVQVSKSPIWSKTFLKLVSSSDGFVSFFSCNHTTNYTTEQNLPPVKSFQSLKIKYAHCLLWRNAKHFSKDDIRQGASNCC